MLFDGGGGEEEEREKNRKEGSVRGRTSGAIQIGRRRPDLQSRRCCLPEMRAEARLDVSQSMT